MQRSLCLWLALPFSIGLNAAEPDVVNVANTACLTSRPELPADRLRRLIDGVERSAVSFPVGSKGEGAFTFTFGRPRRTTGIRFWQPSSIYYTQRFRVEADSDGDGQFGAVLVETEAVAPPSWTSAEWQPVVAHALRLVSTAGESKGRRAHPTVGEIEVFGESLPTDVDDARAVGNPVSHIRHVREMDRWTDLSGKTRPIVILHPDDLPYAEAAKAIAAAIERGGGERPGVTTEPSDALPDRHNVIAIGNVNNNELVARLYWNHYAYEDSLLPGLDAYSLCTVHDPYPWHGKGDVVVVGVSRTAAAGGAAHELAARLGPGKTRVGIGHTLVVSSATLVSKAELKALRAKSDPSFRIFYESASKYLKSGQEAYAHHAITTLGRIVELYEKKPDHDCDWPEETSSDRIFATWDAFEECPLMTDEQRESFTFAFLKLLRALPRHVSGYGRLGKGDLVSWNHTTFPLMGLYFGSRYFWDYYGLSEAEQHLEKAQACMIAQAKSWKPQEDADSYLVITMRHAINYCLAEWRLDLLRGGGAESGHLAPRAASSGPETPRSKDARSPMTASDDIIRAHADYVIGICDSAGLPSGFGDSGIGVTPRLIANVLPRAFWWTRDPGYLWVLRHALGDKWENPFHRDVREQEPKRHVGVRVFPLDRQLYEFTRVWSYYNEPKCPPNVPIEAAFDKISFRESWDKKGQYLLLDGFSRGKHLHYDGNAIIEFVDRGRRWLLDHDYLTRNTTEHNMLSVLRDGRANRLMPSCAGLRCAADVGGKIGLVSTEVKDYLGIDWQRDIFWCKGELFVVMDKMTAREPGHYDLDVVWKVEDRGEEKLMDDGREREFVVRRSPSFGKTRSAITMDDSRASGGKAVLFGDKSSALSLVVDLPQGEYGIAVRAYGIDGSSDSLFASTNGSQRVACHVPQLRYGKSNTKHDQSGALPVIRFAKSGRQVLSLFLRENPPVRVDKITLLGGDGNTVQAIEVEAAEAPRESDLAGVKAERFHIEWPDPAAARTVASKPKGIVVPVRKLFQRLSRDLGMGQSVELANLLYVDDSASPVDYELLRLAPGAVAVQGDHAAVLAIRGAKVGGLSFDAEMVYVSAETVAWAGGGMLRVGEARAETANVCDVEIDVRTGESLGDQTVALKAMSVESVRSWLSSVTTTRKAPSRGEDDRLPRAECRWRLDLEGQRPVRRLRLADLDGDGSTEIVVAAGQTAMALSPDGTRLWSHVVKGPCHDVACGELLPHPGLESVVAGGDTYVHMLDSGGRPISKHQIRGPMWSHTFGDRPWACLTVLPCDLEGDGRKEILVGTQSFELRIYDPEWQILAKARKAVPHGSLDFHVLDANGDGKQEIFTTDRYGSVCVFGSDAKKVGHFYTSIGDMQAAVADLNGDGSLEVVCGSSTGDLICKHLPKSNTTWLGRNAETIWRFDSFGYGVNRLRTADLDGDGRREVVVASQTGYLYVLDEMGKVKWQDKAGADIVEAIVLEGTDFRLAYFDREGTMTLASGDGKMRSRIDLGMCPRRVVQLGDALVVGGEAQLVCVAVEKLR